MLKTSNTTGEMQSFCVRKAKKLESEIKDSTEASTAAGIVTYQQIVKLGNAEYFFHM